MSPGERPSGRRVARNTLFSAVGELSMLLLFALAFLAPRLLGPEAFGHYTAAFAFVGLFRLLPDLGMSYASTIEISRERSRAVGLIGNLLGFQVVLSALTVALCLGVGRWVLGYEGVTWIAVLVLSADLVLKAVKSTLRWALKAFERFGTEAVSLLAERTLLLACGALVLVEGYGVVGFVLVFLLVRLPDAVALFGYVHRRVLPLAPRWEVERWWELMRKGLPFAYAGAVILAFFQIDQVMLKEMRGAVETGWYGVPVKVLEGLTLVPRILGYALIPTLAALHPGAPRAITDLYRRGARYLLAVGLPIAAFGALAAEPFMALLFGEDYLPSAVAARWLLPSAAFMFLSNFGETVLACVNRRGTIVTVSTVALAVNVVLNLLWIPDHGYAGAAWATFITEAAYLAMTAVALHAYGYRISWPAVAVRPLLAAAVFSAVLWTCRDWHLIVASAAASAAWIAAALAFRLLTPDEWRLLRGSGLVS